MDSANSWYEQHPKRTMFAFLLFVLFILELLVRLLASYGLVPISHYPISDHTKRFLVDNNEHFGVWHNPNIEVPSRGPCFDVVYRTNSYGARDVEREKTTQAKRRVVVLGDSFVEGIGVNAEERFTDLVEAQTGIELLNFGVSGDFSSTQEWLLYQELASHFDHSEVFVFFLPANDFRDNEPSEHNPKRYRPYLRPVEDGEEFELYYPIDFEEREIPKGFSARTKISRRIYNHFYLANLFRSSSRLIKEIKAKAFGVHSAEFLSSYDRYSELDMKRLLYGYDKIIRQAEGRPVTIFIIPRQGEFDKFEASKYPYRVVRELASFAKEYANVKIVDLLPHLQGFISKNKITATDLYLQCDGHWTLLGNKATAEVVISELSTSADIMASKGPETF